MKNIVLLGFMGTGKTAVAKALARKLGKKYVSMDDMIIEIEKMSIKDIFDKNGEARFRKLEADVAMVLSAKQDLIIDAGGGVALDQANLDHLAINGILICLDASVDAIIKRTEKHKHRPLLNVENPKAKIEELLNKRAPFYAKIKTHIDTSSKSIDEIVSAIENEIKSN